MKEDITNRELLESVFALRQPDRTPILGGWIACPAHIMSLAGAGEDEYWNDPQGVSIKAYRWLRTSGSGSVAGSVDDHRSWLTCGGISRAEEVATG